MMKINVFLLFAVGGFAQPPHLVVRAGLAHDDDTAAADARTSGGDQK